MKRFVAGFVTLTVLCCMLLAQEIQPFSADTITKMTGRPEAFDGKIYMSPPKMRTDSYYRGHSSEMIVDSDKGIGYRVVPEQRMYMKMNVKGTLAHRGFSIRDYRKFDANNPCRDIVGAKCQRQGAEIVNGRAADKWNLIDDNGKSMTIWLDKKIHYPIKSLLADGTTTELTNIREGTPPTSLFVVPSGFRELNMEPSRTSPPK